MFELRKMISRSRVPPCGHHNIDGSQDLNPVENRYHVFNFRGIKITQKRICYGLSIATVALAASFSLVQFLQYMKFSIPLPHSWMYPICILLGWIASVNCYMVYKLFKIYRANGYSKLEDSVEITPEPNSMQLQRLGESSTRIQFPSAYNLHVLEARTTTVTKEPSETMSGPSSKRKEPIRIEEVVQIAKKAPYKLSQLSRIVNESG